MNEEYNEGTPDLRSNESLNQLIEAIPNGIVMIDEGGQIVLVNQQCEHIFGYHRDELLGRPLIFLMPDRFRDSHTELRSKYLIDPVPWSMGNGRVVFGLRKDGSEVPLEIGLTPLRIAEQPFVLSEVADITVRKQIEAKTLGIAEIEAQESERRHLACELHDKIGQILNVIGIDLQIMKADSESESSRLDDCIQRVEMAIEQVQNFSLELRLPMLDDLGLVATLRSYVDHLVQRAGLILHLVTASSGIPLPSEVVTGCYRVVQEAVANVIRHARAKQLWIEFHENAEVVRLLVRDDGVGFNPAEVKLSTSSHAHFGVLGMKEHVELLGGKFEIKSQPMQGTSIEITIPLTSADFDRTQ